MCTLILQPGFQVIAVNKYMTKYFMTVEQIYLNGHSSTLRGNILPNIKKINMWFKCEHLSVTTFSFKQ